MKPRLPIVVVAAALTAACHTSVPTSPTVLFDQVSAPTPVTPVPRPAPAPSTARYRVVFQSTWSSSTHPTAFPDSAHYSGLIGGTHAASVSFWREGDLATEGIRRMAERGSKSPLDQEVSRAVGDGLAEHLLSGPALNTSPGSVSLDFNISTTFPLVTLVTMIAPSPDWFAGVAGLPLFVDGRWMDEITIDLYGMDAGTDSGMTYSSPDAETNPRQRITRLNGYPVAHRDGVARFGTFTFVKLE